MSLPPGLLHLLDSDDRFQMMCFRLARKDFPNVIPVGAASWDGGRDIVLFDGPDGDIAWQCKFTRRGTGSIKSKIIESLNALDPNTPLFKWILCVPVDATGRFHDWLREQRAKYPFIQSWEVWDRLILLERLEAAPDVLQAFFYRLWSELESKFRSEELELFKYELDPECGWKQRDGSALLFSKTNDANSDLIIDVIVRSLGTIQSLVHGIRVELSDTRTELRGLPGTGLLYAQCTYTVSLHGGKPDTQVERLEPPLLVDAGQYQRFKVKCTDTGFAWRGFLRLTLLYGQAKELPLPWTFLIA